MKLKKLAAVICACIMTAGITSACAEKTDKNTNSASENNGGDAVEASYYNGEHTDTGWEWSNVEIVGGGFVPNIIYNPTEEGLVYCRTDIGGAYRLDKQTNRWVCITDFIGGDSWNYMGIESIATDPVEPNRVYIAAGTYSGSPGAIFYSDDYGENWGIYELPFGCGGNEVGRGAGERLQVDPNDNSILYFGSRADGLWRSTDYGRSWSEVTSFPTKGGYSEEGFNQGLTFVAFDKSSGESGKATQTIFVGAAAAKGNYIYRSDDGGETWSGIENPTAVTTGDNVKLKPAQGEVSSDGYLYTTWSYKIGPNGAMDGAVQKLNISTNEWEEITPETIYTCGYNGISVNPGNPEMIVVTTLDLWAYVDNIFASFDGGKTWGSIWADDENGKPQNNYTLDISSSEWLDWQGQLKPGWWMTGVAINPFNADEIMYGTGATIFGTKNLTKIFDEPLDIEVRAMGIEETAIFDFVSPNANDENAPDLYSIMGDIYGFRHDDANIAPKEHFGDFRSTDIDCASLDYHIVVRATDEGEGTVYYSTDAAETWQETENLPEGVGIRAGGKIKLSADGKTIFYSAGIAGGTFVSDDFGKTWEPCEGLPNGSQIETDKVNPEKFYGAFDGNVYVSEDRGRSFTKLTSILVSNFTMQACPDTEGDLWLSVSGGVYRLDTATGDLEFSSQGVTDCKAMGFGKAEKDGDYMTLYILGEANGQGEGVYMSQDKGMSWKRINDDTQKWGNVNNVISGDPKIFGRVYISTNGRGIIRGDVSE